MKKDTEWRFRLGIYYDNRGELGVLHSLPLLTEMAESVEILRHLLLANGLFIQLR